MRTVTSMPYEVHETEHTMIPLSDGTRLAARIWRPDESLAGPVPAVLEFIPYRKRDHTAPRDAMHHPYLAGHGYAAVRVDLRGSGESDGVLTDEYLEQELVDAEEVLAWLAAQPWCSGRTGMMGISWGGFNALQVAARRPESLGAIATVCSTDDRYADDVHYMGGCLLGDNLSWASTMFSFNSCPPDPALVGDRWKEMWLERMRESGLWVQKWLRHQRRDDYWRHGSICEDYSAVQCPVLAVSGWADGYSNSVFRLMERLDVPRKGLIGPWSHKYPHMGEPGPAVGFLQELVRWWDRWLKDTDNGIMDEPMLRTFMQDTVPPSTAYEDRPGRWVGEPSWPSPHVDTVAFPLLPTKLGDRDERADEAELTVSSPLSVGQFAGKWCSYNAPPDLPYDQREEDGGSLVFDSDVLTESHEILGAPELELECSVDRPVAMVAARLSDVAPDGRATRVTYGLLNLTHRDSDAEPAPLEPGRRYRVRVGLNGVAQHFPAGHRIRLSLSTSYWPLAWTPPEPVCLSVVTGQSTLSLPLRRTGDPDEAPVRPFDAPEGTPPPATTQTRPGEQRWQVTRDLVDYVSELHVVKDPGGYRLDDIDLEVDERVEERYSCRGDAFDSVRGEVVSRVRLSRGDWDASAVTRTVMTSDAHDFHLHAELDAYHGAERVLSLNWSDSIARDCV
ncbi:CocE/NonD family hydrolase [Pseudonocardia sp. KRD291]|uniref:CocE/NonD family hydrolase n=1 Tax=Pseudonocardia sp. KRD291 TaxID=2792007 RepID=UPI001C49FE27|nr:CocE/NonD family hydrolase [Pseudonocardia sp. KRD291]MBW0101326.1 CocE/NonD family hydrolase [Pseudonocardia sp. KRD291]